MQKTPSSKVHMEHFSRIDHTSGHKSNLSKFKKIEIVSSIVSDHKAMRLDINYKEKNCKKHKHLEITNNTCLNSQQITEEIKTEIKICIETNESEKMTTQNLWDSAKQC